MNCSKCGISLGENDVFCPKCGTRVQRTVEVNANAKNEGMNYNYQRPMNQQPASQSYERPINQQSVGQSYERSMNQQPNGQNSAQYGSSKSGGNAVKICVIIIIIAVILAAVGFIAYSVISALSKNNNTQEPIGTTTPSTPSTTSTPSISTSTYKVNYKGFKLYIPDNLMYEFDTTNDAINIGDALSSWAVQLSIQKLPFQQLKQKKSALSSYFAEVLSAYNPKVSNATVETLDGVEFIIMELDLAGTHELVTVSELNSMYVACLEIVNENNDYDREILKNITSILKTAEYQEEVTELKANVKVNTTDINKVLQKVISGQTTDINKALQKAIDE